MKTHLRNRQICTILAAAMLAAALSGCGSSTSDEVVTEPVVNDTAAVTEAETLSVQQEYIMALPEADFGGDTFTILAVSDDIAWGRVSYDAEKEEGEVLNDFIFRRNRAVEDLYNIKLEAVQDSNIPGTVKQTVNSGSDEYDMVSDYAKLVMRDCVNGYYYNLLSIEELNFDNPWWDKACAELMTMSDRLFVAFNDMNTQPLALLSCVFVNNDLISQFDLPSPYQAVLDGTWTMDLFYEMCQDVSGDMNGDGKMDKNDRYGFYTGVGSFNAWMVAADQKYITKQDDGTLTLNYGSAGAIAAAEKIAKIINDPALSVYQNNHPWKSFDIGNALFNEATIGNLESYRNSDINIGVLPIPKFDEAQPAYRAMMSNCSMGVSFLNTIQDPAKAAMIVEALGAHSYIDLRNAYYEITLKDKLSRDEYTAQMLDIIVDNKTVDLGVINESAWGTVISSFLTSIRKSGGGQLASLYEKNVSEFESTLEKIMGQLESLE